ncbi:MAG: VWA domain-containing protein [Magnetospiraceae bacterium]
MIMTPARRLARHIAFVLAVTILLTAIATVDSRAQSLDMTVRLDRNIVLSGAEQPVFVRVGFDVRDEGRRNQARLPLNLGLVLDRSGSMDGQGKIDYLRRASKTVVDQLTHRDRLAIVEYDDRINLLWPSTRVESPAMIKDLIDGLYPRGNTNLAGGMQRGVDEISEFAGDKRLTRILLLSDGLANEGITDPRAIRRLAREARRQGVPVTTLGLGLDYNEDLMQDIAEASGGNYYFIEHPNQMRRIFERELNTLFNTVARDVELRFIPRPIVDGVEVYGQDIGRRDRDTIIPLEDLYAGEQRSVVLRIDHRSKMVGTQPLGVVRLAYTDVKSNQRREVTAPVTVTVTQDPREARRSINKDVRAEAAMVEAEREHEETVKLFQKGKHAEAQKKMQGLSAKLKEENADLNDTRIKKKIEAFKVEQRQMQAATAPAAEPEAQNRFLKRSKQRLYKASKGQRGLYMMEMGDSGPEVRRLQEALKDSGHYSGPISGTYDKSTADAVRDYQKSKKLDTDGIAGPATLEEMGLY